MLRDCGFAVARKGSFRFFDFDGVSTTGKNPSVVVGFTRGKIEHR